MKAIYKREIQNYLKTPLGFVFIGIFLLVSGYFFVDYNLSLSYPTTDMLGTFGNLGVILILLVPILTMRLIAEERHSKTDQLLLTSPNSAFSIVFAKFLACITLFAIALVIMLIYPIILTIFGSPAWATIFTIYIGFLFMGVSLIALGIFCSSLTENQVVAAIISFVIMLFIWFVGGIASSVTNSWILDFLAWFSVLARYDNFSNGTMDISAILYFISFTAVFIFLATIKFDRNFMKKWKFGIPIAVLAIAVVIAINAVFPIVTTDLKWNTTFDLTSSKVFTISKTTKDAMSSLTDDVKLIYISDSPAGDIGNVLHQYVMSSSHITYETDTVESAQTALLNQQYGTTLAEGNIVVASDKRNQVLDISNWVDQSTGAYYGEIDLTNAILGVTADKLPVIGVVTGHGGQDVSGSYLEQIVQGRGMTITDVNTITNDIPSNIDVLLIISPLTDFSMDEITKLDNYVQSGKGLQVYFDTTTPTLKNLEGYLDNWGVTFAKNTVFETDTSRYKDNQDYIAADLDDQPITSSLANNGEMAVVDSGRQTLIDDSYSNDAVTRDPLISSSSTSYAQDTAGNKTQGPIDLSVIAYKTNDAGNPTASVLFAGSANIIDSQDIFYNQDFFINAVNWQANATTYMDITPKNLMPGTLNLNANQYLICVAIVLVVLPVGMLVAGLVVWLKRRKL